MLTTAPSGGIIILRTILTSMSEPQSDKARPVELIRESAVNQPASHWRGSSYIARYTVLTGMTCPTCGNGEMHQPMQTMDMPMHAECLRCGSHCTMEDADHREASDT